MATTEKITTVHLMGGLGNQLFQLFTAAAHARKHGARLVLPAWVQGGRPAYWDSLFRSIHNLVAQDTATLRSLATFPVYKETVFHYISLPILHTQLPTLALHGYFQSPLYFQDEFAAIADQLRLKEQRNEVRQRFQASLQGVGVITVDAPLHSAADSQPMSNTIGVADSPPVEKLVALHIRIGDYARYPDHHPILPVGYYEAALLECLVPNGRVLVFSEKDDRARVDAEYIGPLQVAFPGLRFEHVSDIALQGMSDWEELLLMSCCSAIVMANSSFSWWAAYFSTRLGSQPVQVFYPATWFGRALRNNDTKDMFPAEWHAIIPL